jgi:hypothetical protein
MDAFVKSINLSTQLINIDLTSCQLNVKKMQMISEHFSEKLKSLKVSNNPNIGFLGI